MTQRAYLTEMIAQVEQQAIVKRSEADMLVGQALAYRDLLSKMGPESVPSPREEPGDGTQGQ